MDPPSENGALAQTAPTTEQGGRAVFRWLCLLRRRRGGSPRNKILRIPRQFVADCAIIIRGRSRGCPPQSERNRETPSLPSGLQDGGPGPVVDCVRVTER